MTAIPCGQKKSSNEMIQSQMVTPPLAAIDGTTLRLKTATTKRRTRSQRPRTRRRCGASDAACVAAGEVAVSGEVAISFDNAILPKERKIKARSRQVFRPGQLGRSSAAPLHDCAEHSTLHHHRSHRTKEAT